MIDPDYINFFQEAEGFFSEEEVDELQQKLNLGKMTLAEARKMLAEKKQSKIHL